MKSSQSTRTDTIIIPVSAKKSHKEWDRSSVIFRVKDQFDIVQFDYFSDMFKSSNERLRVYAYLDDFQLIQTNKEPTVFKIMDAEHAAVLEGAPFSYYFESDIERLDKKDMKKFISEIQKIELQYIANISVTGYTDNTDSQEYNDVLSTARAETILEVIK